MKNTSSLSTSPTHKTRKHFSCPHGAAARILEIVNYNCRPRALIYCYSILPTQTSGFLLQAHFNSFLSKCCSSSIHHLEYSSLFLVTHTCRHCSLHSLWKLLYIYGFSVNLDTNQHQIRKLSRNVRTLCEQLQQEEKHHQWLQRKSLEIQKITKNSSFSIGFSSFFHLGFSEFCGKNKIVFTYVVMGCTEP